MSRLKITVAAAASAAAVIAAAAVIPAAVAQSSPPPGSAARLLASGVLPPSWELLHAAPPAAAPAAVPVTAPLLPSQCQARYGSSCYDAALLRRIYGTGALPAGIDGRGVTVVLRHDLEVYTAQAGLPEPDLHLITIGHPGVADPGNPEQAAAQEEGELDAEMILAMAPRVRLDFVETEQDPGVSPASFSAATTVVALLARMRPAVDAVSFSYGWFEANYAEAAGSPAGGAAMIRAQAAAVDLAAGRGITVISADGDTGPAAPDLAGTGLYPDPTVAAMAADPLVTAVSGTQVTADDSGTRTAPDVVWSAPGGAGGATGGGLSAVFARPGWQDPYAAIVGDHRGAGDVSMDASGQSRVWIYTSRYQLLPGQAPGWVRIAGTSVAAPLFTGIVALADQMAGHRLGAANARLYAMAQDPAASGIRPVTSGCNTDFGIAGYCAGDGPYTLPDGVGTVVAAALFVPALAGLTPGGR
jgi:subtilase family serine protease